LTSRDYQDFFSSLAPLLDAHDRDSFFDDGHGRVAKQENKPLKGKYS
jgi:hypothetical protein